LIGFQLHAKERESKAALKRPSYYPETQARPQYALQVSDNTLQQVEKFQHLALVFTSDKRRNREIDTRIGKANAILRELYRSVVTKWEHLNIVKLSVYWSQFRSSPMLINLG